MTTAYGQHSKPPRVSLATIRKYSCSPAFDEQRFAYSCLIPAAFVIFAFQVVPLIYSLYIATSDYFLGTRAKFVGLRNFTKFFQSEDGITVLGNTLTYTAVSVSLSFVIGLALAFLLNRPFRGERVVRTLLLLPLMVSPVVSGSAWAFIFNDQYGLVNQVLRSFGMAGHHWLADSRFALWIVILVGTWISIPWFTILFYAGLQALPVSLFEAVSIDGAGWWQKVRCITLPLLLPVIMVALVIQIINGLMVYDIVYVITFGGPGRSSDVLTLTAYKEAFYFFHLGYGTSIAVIAALIALLLGVPAFTFLSKKAEKVSF